MEKISIDILNTGRKKVGSIDITPHLFPKLQDRGDIYYAMKAYEAQSKQKCGYTKGRSEVKATGAKMYKQKGTGQARHHAYSAPQFVGGGIVFGPKGVKGVTKVNRKVWRRAMQLLLVEKIKNAKVLVFDDLTLKEKKTKEALRLFPEARDSRVVFVDDNNDSLGCSVRNIANSRFSTSGFFTVEDLYHSDAVVFSKNSFEKTLNRISNQVSRRGSAQADSQDGQ